MEKGKKGSARDPRFTKRGQLTIFIIVGLILVVGVVGFFLIRDNASTGISKEFEPAYKSYLSCIQESAEQGIELLGQQGGHIYTDELGFDSGSSYMPSSSQLDFLGSSVPYWLYISGNNILKEQIPSKTEMETELARYIRERLADCDFSSFNEQGIYLDIVDGEVNVAINSNDVNVEMKNPVFFTFENESAYVNEHRVQIVSKLGNFYDYASNVYNFEKTDFFLESYALDVLRLNSPVTGVEVTCKPKVFNEVEVKNDLADALQNNFAYLKFKGDYYSLTDEKNNYFVVDSGQNVDANVNVIYSKEWPTKIEMYGEKIVQPVGTQNGLGILGMCFVPYHFVYDMSFPVMIQFYSNDELFQFPVVVIIKNTQARQALLTDEEISADSPICQTRNQQVQVSTYDLELKPVEANLRFSCLTDSCDVGSTVAKVEGASAVVDLPQCVNAVLTAYADGYAPSNYVISTNSETTADILMKKIYDVKVDLGNVASASVVFSSPDYSAVLNYPEDKTVSLIEGEYNITAYVYKNSTIVFPAVNDRKCIEVTSTSFAGILGDSKEQCFDINILSQEVDMALVGGGRGFDYFTETQFKESELNLNIPLFKTPTNLQELQNNYITWEDSTLETRWE